MRRDGGGAVTRAAADLASWAECSLADLELGDDATIDDVCDALNQEGW